VKVEIQLCGQESVRTIYNVTSIGLDHEVFHFYVTENGRLTVSHSFPVRHVLWVKEIQE